MLTATNMTLHGQRRLGTKGNKVKVLRFKLKNGNGKQMKFKTQKNFPLLLQHVDFLYERP